MSNSYYRELLRNPCRIVFQEESKVDLTLWEEIKKKKHYQNYTGGDHIALGIMA